MTNRVRPGCRPWDRMRSGGCILMVAITLGFSACSFTGQTVEGSANILLPINSEQDTESQPPDHIQEELVNEDQSDAVQNQEPIEETADASEEDNLHIKDTENSPNNIEPKTQNGNESNGSGSLLAFGASSDEHVPEKLQIPRSAQDSELEDEDPFFSDALFIGDSRTQGLMMYGRLDNATFYTEKGLSVKDVFEKDVINTPGGKVPIAEALKGESFGKVYLMLGINELGWVYPEIFIEKYGEIIDLIRETQPEAIIYVQSVLPVTQEKSDKDLIFNNSNIERFNGLIKTMVREKQVVYLNVSEAVIDENGALCSDSSTDGVHLNKTYCIKWGNYLRQHKSQAPSAHPRREKTEAEIETDMEATLQQ